MLPLGGGERPRASAAICRAAAAVDTSKATMRRWRGSMFFEGRCRTFVLDLLPSVSGLGELGYGLQQRHRRWTGIRGLVEVQADLLHTTFFEAQCARGVVGNVDDPVVHKGTPIIDAYHHDLAVPQVGDLDERAQRKAGVSGREIAHLEGFSAGCLPALELLSIPGRGAYLIRLRLRAVGPSGFVPSGLNDQWLCDLGGFQAAWPGCGSGPQTGDG